MYCCTLAIQRGPEPGASWAQATRRHHPWGPWVLSHIKKKEKEEEEMKREKRTRYKGRNMYIDCLSMIQLWSSQTVERRFTRLPPTHNPFWIATTRGLEFNRPNHRVHTAIHSDMDHAFRRLHFIRCGRGPKSKLSRCGSIQFQCRLGREFLRWRIRRMNTNTTDDRKIVL